MTRNNLVIDSSLRSGNIGYYQTLGDSALTYSTDYGFYGAGSLLVFKSGENNSGVQTLMPMAVVAGKPYAASVYVRLPLELPAEEDANLVLRVEWRNSLNIVLSTDSTSILTLTDSDGWARIGGVWTAPVGATVAFIQVAQVVAGTPNARFFADAFMFEQSNYIGGYTENMTQAEETRLVNQALSAPVRHMVNGLELNADVILNDFVLNTIDEHGNIWIVTDIDGWWGQATPESPDIPRGTEDGSYDVSGRYQARLFTLTGTLYPATPEGLGDARDSFVTATNLVRRGGWLQANENPTRAAYVRLSGRPMFRTVNARGKTEFSIGLKAGDPIKYHWNDQDAEGFTHVMFSSGDDGDIASIGNALNIGTADVTAVFTLTGPIGAGTSIYNAATDETLTIVEALRGAGVTASITKAGVTDGVATITTGTDHYLQIGDEINIAGAGSPYDSGSTTFTVTAASNIFPFTFSYDIASDDLDELTATGQVSLVNNDVLVIDTYNRSVTYNGSTIGHRSKLKTLTDWIKLTPGNNPIELSDNVTKLSVVTKSTIGGVSTLVLDDTHYLIPGEEVLVALNEVAALSKKSLTSNFVTLTTRTPHGFSVSDKVDVASTEISVVNNKSASTTVATVTTVDTNGVSVTDVINVALPVSASPASKQLTSNVATIGTQFAHGFSVGDSVIVALGSLANVINKALTSNQVTLTTSGSHNFQLGDSITVSLGTTATITNKAKAGAQAIITTQSAHGFSAGDSVTIALPTAATLANTRSITGSAGGYVVTLFTSGNHLFSTGDQIAVNVGLPTAKATTNRASSTFTRTITTSGNHGWSIGEQVIVSGLTTDYNGTFTITAVTANTFSYVAATSLAESTTAAAGAATNNTISNSYNGTKVIESVPSGTTLTYLAYDQDVATSSTATGTGATLTDTTNAVFNGTKTLLSVSSTTFTYNL